MIWAQDLIGGIGKNGKLPWNISEDLQNFKKITSGFPIIMGRKTWESLPFKPLPKRRNIVISSKEIKNTEVYHSIEECTEKLKMDSIDKVFIIGGRSIYKSFYNHATVLHSTIINKEVDGIDTFFPISLNNIKKEFYEANRIKLSKLATYISWNKIN